MILIVILLCLVIAYAYAKRKLVDVFLFKNMLYLHSILRFLVFAYLIYLLIYVITVFLNTLPFIFINYLEPKGPSFIKCIVH